MSLVIKVENLSKAYQIGEFSTGTISRDIERWWAGLRGKEDPFLKIGETNDRTTKGESNLVWSLKDLDFEINQGDAVGIIGRNGAGKSTLLKLLSRVTSPTTGSIKVKGRIASLLEVGTGFHPELTGRENIFLNGAILGMRKKEIKKRFDEIVDFAGVERYIDTPVKRYSSGMYVRLAFAVAAHLESEILIVDEVLAVGDAEFQRKCLGKMGEVSKGDGRTVLFVSHNIDSLRMICQKGLLLNNGKLNTSGTLSTVVNAYMESYQKRSRISKIDHLQLTPEIMLDHFSLDQGDIRSLGNLGFELRLLNHTTNPYSSVAIFLYGTDGQKVAFLDLRTNDLYARSIASNLLVFKGCIENLPLMSGVYSIGIHIQSALVYKDFFDLLSFEVIPRKQSGNIIPYPTDVRGKIELAYTFSLS